MHEKIGQLAICSEKDQATGVNVQPAYRDPAPVFYMRKAIVNGWTLARVSARTNFTCRFMIGQHPELLLRRRRQIQLLTIQSDVIINNGPIT